MKNYVIISDSSLDLPKDIREKFDIEFPIPGKIIYSDGRIEDADSDWERSTPEDYFEGELKKGIKTSLPNQFEIESRLEPFLEQGLDILAIVLSSGISGTYSAFVTAGEELMKKYKDRKVIVVDSLRYSSAVGLLCIDAALNRNAGMSIEDNAALINKRRLTVHQCGVLDDLKFLARNGKITGFKAFMGTMIGIKSIADFSNQTGQPFPLGTARGYKRAFAIIQKYVEITSGTTKGKLFVVEHSMRPELAEKLKAIIEENFEPADVIMTRCGQTNGSAIGPGLATIFYFGDEPISEGVEKEVKLFKEISANLR